MLPGAAEQAALDPEASAVIAQMLGALRLAGQKPGGGKAGKQLRDPVGRQPFADTGELGEGMVVPDHLVLVQMHQRHREGHFPIGHLVHHVVVAAQILRHDPAATAGRGQIYQVQPHGDHGLHRTQNILLQHQCRCAKQRHDHKICHQVGP